MKQTLFPLSLLVALLFVGIGCDRRPFKDDPAFDDKVLILENNPELLLVRMTKDFLADRPITDEASATDFLVRTLAQVYTVYGTVPERERLEQCLAIFRSARKAQQQLETLYLLADIHRRNNDLRGELDIIQRSIDLAEAVNDPVWLFYLYSYLGDMYRREGDLVRLYPSLTEKEVQLCCLLTAGFRTDEIAGVWMQSVFSVHKCKTDVRKKLGVPDGGDITAFLRQEVQESAR